ncbi:MAG: hypothetical protein ACE5MK_07665, partial [Acidobacteriota bacterium]
MPTSSLVTLQPVILPTTWLYGVLSSVSIESLNNHDQEQYLHVARMKPLSRSGEIHERRPPVPTKKGDLGEVAPFLFTHSELEHVLERHLHSARMKRTRNLTCVR